MFRRLTTTRHTVLSTREFCSTKSAPKKWPGVVIGEIQSVSVHPQADRLHLCQVQINNESESKENTSLIQIVCGAPNVKPGLKVPVATVGTRLSIPSLEKPLKIKKSKLRGEVSMGMICSESELGLVSEPSVGILELPQESIVGKQLEINDV